MGETIFTCPKCGKRFKRDWHYLNTIFTQNLIVLMSGGEEIEDICMCCNYIEYKNNQN